MLMRLRTARGKGAAGAEGGEGEEAAGEEEGSPLARTTRRRPPERHVVRAVAPAPTLFCLPDGDHRAD